MPDGRTQRHHHSRISSGGEHDAEILVAELDPEARLELALQNRGGLAVEHVVPG